ncbi:MAG: N-acetylglucosamine kinase [Bacteroides sp.]|nr:MAG: N-acetylglucosamine kinase [Bacteroides sp.]
MIIIADGGSTKTSWCIITDYNKKFFLETIGYNPLFIKEKDIIESLHKNLYINSDDRNKISCVYYYGAGANYKNQKIILKNALQNYFTKSKIIINHDLLGAAYALLGNNKGFVSILGTGTNTCIYNGTEITYNIDSLGYFFGDEGSGSYLGKKLLKDYMRNLMPRELSNIFYQTYKLKSNDIINILSKNKLNNVFLAQFSKFLNINNWSSYTHNIIKSSFKDFFKNIVSQYNDYSCYNFNCVGSIGYIYKDILCEVSLDYNMKPDKIIKSPIKNLVDYHIDNITN